MAQSTGPCTVVPRVCYNQGSSKAGFHTVQACVSIPHLVGQPQVSVTRKCSGLGNRQYSQVDRANFQWNWLQTRTAIRICTAHNCPITRDPSMIAYPETIFHTCITAASASRYVCMASCLTHTLVAGAPTAQATSYIYVSTPAGTWVITLPQMLLLT